MILWAILVGGLAYQTLMWIYNKMQKGEAFSAQKFALTFGYVSLLAISAYVVTGAIPEVAEIILALGEDVPDPATVFTALAGLLIAIYQQGGKIVAQIKGTPQATQEPVASTPTPDPVVIPTDPAAYKKVDDATLRWLTFDATPENKAAIIAQVEAAEKQQLNPYMVRFDGGFYVIKDGILTSSAGNPSGK